MRGFHRAAVIKEKLTAFVYLLEKLLLRSCIPILFFGICVLLREGWEATRDSNLQRQEWKKSFERDYFSVMDYRRRKMGAESELFPVFLGNPLYSYYCLLERNPESWDIWAPLQTDSKTGAEGLVFQNEQERTWFFDCDELPDQSFFDCEEWPDQSFFDCEELPDQSFFEKLEGAVPRSPVPEKKRAVDVGALSDFDRFLREFYTVDETTFADADLLNAQRFLLADLHIEKKDGPQILIYHTHGSEEYADSTPGDRMTGVMGVGAHLASILENTYGFEVLHCTEIFDEPSRDNAYYNASPSLNRILQENPQIQVVIDLHRDDLPAGVDNAVELDGKRMARFMFFNGLSRTRSGGVRQDLYNVYQEENLAFSFQMQKLAMEYFPGLTRKIYLKGYRYNMHLRGRSLLVEMGAQSNTYEEAINSCEPLAALFAMVLEGNAGSLP